MAGQQRPRGRFLEEIDIGDPPKNKLAPFSLRPERYSNLADEGLITPVRDQGNFFTCTSFGVCAILESRYLLLNQQAIELAPGWIHTCIGQVPSDTAIDLRYVVEALAGRTIPLASRAPYPWPHASCNEPGFMVTPAFSQIVGADAIRTALDAKLPVVTGMAYDTRFETWNSQTPYASDMSNSAKLWHHVVVIVGFDPSTQQWLCKNSMGDSWGVNGYFFAPVGTCGIGIKYRAYAASTIEFISHRLLIA